MTDHDSSRRPSSPGTRRPESADAPALPDLDLDAVRERIRTRSAATAPVAPPRENAQPAVSTPRQPAPTSGVPAEPAIDTAAAQPREDQPAPAPIAVPVSAPQAGGSLSSWRYAADAWRLNSRLSRRQADLVLRARTATAVPASVHARIAAMGLPDDVTAETLGSIRSLDAWPNAWIETAQRYLGDFRRQVSAGNQIDGARNQAMAALCYHIAQFITRPDDRRTATMCRAAAASLYNQALPYVHPTATRVVFPWRTKSLPGYLHIPHDVPADGRYGLVVMLNGASSSKEESFTWAGPFMRAGLAVLTLDTPGTGETASTPFSIDQDDILDGVFDLLAPDPRLDLRKVVVVGTSLGGNQAIRSAADDRRIAGVVAITPPVEPSRWIRRISPLLGHELIALTDLDADAVLALAGELDLGPVMPNLSCPVLVIGAGRDVVVPPADAQRLASALGDLATLDWFPSAGHGVYDQVGTWAADAARWALAVMDATLSGVATGNDRLERSRQIAAIARDALLTPVAVEDTWDGEVGEGARLLSDDEILDDDPDWYTPAP